MADMGEWGSLRRGQWGVLSWNLKCPNTDARSAWQPDGTQTQMGPSSCALEATSSLKPPPAMRITGSVWQP